MHNAPHRYIYIYILLYTSVHKHGICFRNSMSVHVFLPFGAQWITIRNFVFEHISSDVLPFYAPQKSCSFKTVTNFTLCFRAKISRALLWNGIECACIFTEQWTLLLFILSRPFPGLYSACKRDEHSCVRIFLDDDIVASKRMEIMNV